MGNDCTISTQVIPYRPRPRMNVVKFTDKNVFYSAEKLSEARVGYSASSLERRGKELLMGRLEEQDLDRAFVREFSEELKKAKVAMDDCLYDDLRANTGEMYSIVPFSPVTTG
uniref:Uncharacterized protein n=1 Tax=viral metagenome TaxID=1070528 RepID=A0A6C0EKM0_9ZZZZ